MLPFESLAAAFSMPTKKGLAKALFTTRLGGYSKGNYFSLNLDLQTGDDESSVSANRKKVSSYLADTNDFISVHQEHGTKIHFADNASITHKNDIIADSIITSETLCPIGVLVADCVPILLIGENGVVGAIHAGWKGLLAKNVFLAADSFFELNQDAEAIALIGPSVGECCYNVSKELAQKFNELFPGSVVKVASKNHIDLKSVARMQLQMAGFHPSNIWSSSLCTFCNPHIFFSYRKQKETGRQAGIVVIKEKGS